MAVDMFIKIGDIKGESRDATYKEWIDVLAWSWGMSQSGSAHVGGGMGAGKVNVQDLSLTKYVDTATTDLMLKCSTGKHYDSAELIVRKAGDKPLEYINIKLTDVLITSVSTGGSGGEDRLTENVSLNFAEFNVKYTQQEASGAKGVQPEVKFNIAENVQK